MISFGSEGFFDGDTPLPYLPEPGAAYQEYARFLKDAQSSYDTLQSIYNVSSLSLEPVLIYDPIPETFPSYAVWIQNTYGQTLEWIESKAQKPSAAVPAGTDEQKSVDVQSLAANLSTQATFATRQASISPLTPPSSPDYDSSVEVATGINLGQIRPNPTNYAVASLTDALSPEQNSYAEELFLDEIAQRAQYAPASPAPAVVSLQPSLPQIRVQSDKPPVQACVPPVPLVPVERVSGEEGMIIEPSRPAVNPRDPWQTPGGINSLLFSQHLQEDHSWKNYLEQHLSSVEIHEPAAEHLSTVTVAPVNYQESLRTALRDTRYSIPILSHFTGDVQSDNPATAESFTVYKRDDDINFAQLLRHDLCLWSHSLRHAVPQITGLALEPRCDRIAELFHDLIQAGLLTLAVWHRTDNLLYEPVLSYMLATMITITTRPQLGISTRGSTHQYVHVVAFDRRGIDRDDLCGLFSQVQGLAVLPTLDVSDSRQKETLRVRALKKKGTKKSKRTLEYYVNNITTGHRILDLRGTGSGSDTLRVLDDVTVKRSKPKPPPYEQDHTAQYKFRAVDKDPKTLKRHVSLYHHTHNNCVSLPDRQNDPLGTQLGLDVERSVLFFKRTTPELAPQWTAETRWFHAGEPTLLWKTSIPTVRVHAAGVPASPGVRLQSQMPSVPTEEHHSLDLKEAGYVDVRIIDLATSPDLILLGRPNDAHIMQTPPIPIFMHEGDHGTGKLLWRMIANAVNTLDPGEQDIRLQLSGQLFHGNDRWTSIENPHPFSDQARLMRELGFIAATTPPSTQPSFRVSRASDIAPLASVSEEDYTGPPAHSDWLIRSAVSWRAGVQYVTEAIPLAPAAQSTKRARDPAIHVRRPAFAAAWRHEQCLARWNGWLLRNNTPYKINADDSTDTGFKGVELVFACVTLIEDLMWRLLEYPGEIFLPQKVKKPEAGRPYYNPALGSRVWSHGSRGNSFDQHWAEIAYPLHDLYKSATLESVRLLLTIVESHFTYPDSGGDQNSPDCRIRALPADDLTIANNDTRPLMGRLLTRGDTFKQSLSHAQALMIYYVFLERVWVRGQSLWTPKQSQRIQAQHRVAEAWRMAGTMLDWWSYGHPIALHTRVATANSAAFVGHLPLGGDSSTTGYPQYNVRTRQTWRSEAQSQYRHRENNLPGLPTNATRLLEAFYGNTLSELRLHSPIHRVAQNALLALSRRLTGYFAVKQASGTYPLHILPTWTYLWRPEDPLLNQLTDDQYLEALCSYAFSWLAMHALFDEVRTFRQLMEAPIFPTIPNRPNKEWDTEETYIAQVNAAVPLNEAYNTLLSLDGLVAFATYKGSEQRFTPRLKSGLQRRGVFAVRQLMMDRYALNHRQDWIRYASGTVIDPALQRLETAEEKTQKLLAIQKHKKAEAEAIKMALELDAQRRQLKIAERKEKKRKAKERKKKAATHKSRKRKRASKGDPRKKRRTKARISRIPPGTGGPLVCAGCLRTRKPMWVARELDLEKGVSAQLLQPIHYCSARCAYMQHL